MDHMFEDFMRFENILRRYLFWQQRRQCSQSPSRTRSSVDALEYAAGNYAKTIDLPFGYAATICNH